MLESYRQTHPRILRTSFGNRGDSDKAGEIAYLVKDESAMVRSCAVGALGYLKSKEYAGAILALFDDESDEVRQSAEHAAKLVSI